MADLDDMLKQAGRIMQAEMARRAGYPPKADWGQGEWQAEDDRYEWRRGDLVCLIIRNPAGALCGYVGVPAGHPWHGQKYGDIDGVEVHGGLTYSSGCAGHICHEPKPGEGEVWWVGFDCAHCFDRSPGMEALLRQIRGPSFEDPDATYKPVEYVRQWVERLADQAAAMR